MELELDNIEYFQEKNNLIQELISALKTKLEEEILVIDRFEGGIAVCEERETGRMINIKKEILPIEANEGDIIRYKNCEYVIDYEEKQTIKNRINEKVKNLFED